MNIITIIIIIIITIIISDVHVLLMSVKSIF